MTTIFKRLFDFLSSFGLAVVLILLMLALTFFGTLEQVELGINEVQKRYFESLFVVHNLFDAIPIPLPGGYLVMSLFFVNLICGGIVRIRKNKQTAGVLITHVGIIVLLLGGFVTFQYSISGNMRLYEGQSSNEFVSYYDWQVELGEAGKEGELLVIPQEQFRDLKAGESRTFHSGELPFEVTLSGYARNSAPMPVRSSTPSSIPAVDGYYLEKLPLEKEAERNVAGIYASVKNTETGEEKQGILWGLSVEPWTVEVGDSQWTAEMARKRWEVPFTVVLDDFKRELHPGTSMAASFESEITKIEGDSAERIRIFMNNPLRYKGYTFFQASWGPQNAGPNERLFSVFAVKKDPADHWPLYACIIIGLGMTAHFGQRLVRYVRRENKRRTT